MFIVLSPAKSLDLGTPAPAVEISMPVFRNEAAQLIELARRMSADEVAQLMSVSGDLAKLNAQRFQQWQHDHRDGRPAIFTFNGDVYGGLAAQTLSQRELDYLQAKLGILSGLYGVLKPFDAMHPYRLEMGTRFANVHGANLYAFWGGKVTDHIVNLMQKSGSRYLLNLASEEYFKAIKRAKLVMPVIDAVFQDWKNGQYKIISFYAKRARGLMARYCARHEINSPEQLTNFDLEGYRYVAAESSGERLVFRRKLEE